MIPEIPVNGLTLILGGARSGKKQHNRGKSRDAKPAGDKASDDKKNKTIRHF